MLMVEGCHTGGVGCCAAEKGAVVMQIGVVFPQTEIGADPVAICDYVQAAENLGYAHLLVYDHVLGAEAQRHAGWSGSRPCWCWGSGRRRWWPSRRQRSMCSAAAACG